MSPRGEQTPSPYSNESNGADDVTVDYAALLREGAQEETRQLSGRQLDDEQRGGRHDVDPQTQQAIRRIYEREARGLAAGDDPIPTYVEAPGRAADQAALHEAWARDFVAQAQLRDGETAQERAVRVSGQVQGLELRQRAAILAAAEAAGDTVLTHIVRPDDSPVKTAGSLGLPVRPVLSSSREASSGQLVASAEAGSANVVSINGEPRPDNVGPGIQLDTTQAAQKWIDRQSA